eukprot:gene2340-3081_t
MTGTQAETFHPPQQARHILRGGRGTRYDARVVDELMAVLAAADAEQVQESLIEARDLRPGMVLAGDLLSARGAILLASGHVFDEQLVRQVTAFAKRQNVRLVLRVRATTPAGLLAAGAEAAALLAAMPLPAALHSGGLLLGANDALARLSGHTVQALLQLPFSSLVIPSQQPALIEASNQCLVQHTAPPTMDALVQHADGSERPVELHVRPLELGG